MSNVSVEDEKYIAAIGAAGARFGRSGSGSAAPVFIADCRPRTNAYANIAAGFGFEGDRYDAWYAHGRVLKRCCLFEVNQPFACRLTLARPAQCAFLGH